ncbi:MAG: exodeoxyribonuclease III [Polyangiaceae bacterium]
MKVITWNVNGIRAREKEVLALLEEESPDVLMLQETKAKIEQLPPSLYGLGALPTHHAIWHGNAGYSGVAVLLKKSAFDKPTDARPPFDFETRVVEAHAGDFVFVSMYLPNGGKDFPAKIGFMKALVDYPKSFADKKLIIAGDLNVARAEIDVHSSQRNSQTIGQTAEERVLFEEFLAAGKLLDVSRHLAPGDTHLFSWWPYWRNARERNIGWRLDYVLANPALASGVKSSQIRREFGTSDHGPLVVVFD